MKSFPNPAARNRPRPLGGARRGRAAFIWPLVALAVIVAACADDADTTTAGGASATASTAPVPAAAGSSAAPTTAAMTPVAPTPLATTTDAASGEPAEQAPVAVSTEWVRHRSGDDCRCSDGSEHAFHTRAGDPDKVLLYFQGGGACVDAVSCGSADPTYKATTWPTDHPDENSPGIFAVDEPRNPFGDWTQVYVPYCSADFYLGDAVTTYAPGVTIEHRGVNIAHRALDHVVATYGDLDALVVAGTSAGAVPTPLVAGLASDRLPAADIAVLADGAGGYPSEPELNRFLATVWGTAASMPTWPELSSVGVDEWGIPDLFTHAGTHDPAIRMARFDDTEDGVQVFFAGILDGAASRWAGTDTTFDGDLPASLDRNERRTEDAGVPLDVYLAPGNDHTVLDQPRLYDLEVGGVALVDWIAELAAGGAPGDVR